MVSLDGTLIRYLFPPLPPHTGEGEGAPEDSEDQEEEEEAVPVDEALFDVEELDTLDDGTNED